MGKDLIQKRYLGDNRRYADLINGYMFNGEQVVLAKDLTEMNSQVGIWRNDREGKAHYCSKYRDLMKKTAFGINFAVIGTENQEEVHYLMPLRSMGYDVAEYERQAELIKKSVRRMKGITKAEFLSGFRKDSRLYPCITLVLYYGDDWDGSKDLHGILDFAQIPEKMKQYVNNYRIHLLEVKKIENTGVFRTDLKQIFDFIRCSDDKQKLLELVENDPTYKEMEEDAYEMALAYADAEELVGIQKYQGKDGKVNMCEGIRGLIDDGRAEGMEIGRRIGSEETTKNIVKNMLKREMSEEDIMALAECEQAMIEVVKKEMEEEAKKKCAGKSWFSKWHRAERKIFRKIWK